MGEMVMMKIARALGLDPEKTTVRELLDAMQAHTQVEVQVTDPREAMGRLVRQIWVNWAREQPNPKPSWLKPWEELSDADREVDMRIGYELFEMGRTYTALHGSPGA